MKDRRRDPAFVDKLLAASAASNDRPEVKAAKAAALRRMRQDPAFVEKLRAASAASQSRPEVKARKSEIMKERRRDPAYVDKLLAAAAASQSRPDVRARKSESLKKHYALHPGSKRPSAGRRANGPNFAEIVECLRAGDLYRAIAERFGISKQRVAQVAKKSGLARRNG